MAPRRMKRLIFGPLPAILLATLLLVSLFVMSEVTQNSERFGRVYVWLLVLNIGGLVAMLAVIGTNLYRLAQQYRQQAPGARLSLRLVVVFSMLALAPASLLYYFSLQFLHRGIDSWFDVRIEQSLTDSLELGRSSLDLYMRELLRKQQQIATQLALISHEQTTFEIDNLLLASGASELTLMGANAHIIAAASSDPTTLVPYQPPEEILLLLRQGEPYFSLDPIQDQELLIRILVPVASSVETEALILQAIYPVPKRIDTLATNVEEAFTQYRELSYLRTPLKYSFTLTLTLVLLFSLLAAVSAALFSAHRLTAPIRDLVAGTRRIASGDYGQRLPLPGSDDLGILVRSFNDMTQRIARSRDIARVSQDEVEQQKAYLEVVLGNLSSGVLSFDTALRLRTANLTAARILDIPQQALAGSDSRTLADEHHQLAPLFEVFHAHTAESGYPMWQAEITLFLERGRMVLMCRGTELIGHDPEHSGHVLVFEDITALIQAQRDAAWGEAARRMAHEIKNPLTPIRLSAERMRYKCAPSLPEETREILERHTEMIVQQVEMMKEMVDAFSEYARAPAQQRAPVELNALVCELIGLYRDSHAAITMETDLDEALPTFNGDPVRLRQLLHNLLKNGVEALEKSSDGHLQIRTRYGNEADGSYAEIQVTDNGPGIDEKIRAHLFEPYMTTKPKGTGLGLAIVKKIVDEHSGIIKVKESPAGGTIFTIRLPLAGETDPALGTVGEHGTGQGRASF